MRITLQPDIVKQKGAPGEIYIFVKAGQGIVVLS